MLKSYKGSSDAKFVCVPYNNPVPILKQTTDWPLKLDFNFTRHCSYKTNIINLALYPMIIWTTYLVIKKHNNVEITSNSGVKMLVFWIMYEHLSFFNSSPPGKKWPSFHRQYFKCNFVNEKFYILIEISLKFVPKGPIDNNPALV